MSTPAKLPSVSSRTGTWPLLNGSVLPAERADANSSISDNGKRRCSRQRISSTPTAPVAPTMATTGFASFFEGIRFSKMKRPRRISGGASRCSADAQLFASTHTTPALPQGAFEVVRLSLLRLTARDISRVRREGKGRKSQPENLSSPNNRGIPFQPSIIPQAQREANRGRSFLHPARRQLCDGRAEIAFGHCLEVVEVRRASLRKSVNRVQRDLRRDVADS